MPSILHWRLLHFIFLLCFFHLFHSLEASPQQEFPILYKGRYRPAEAYARLWLYDMYHAQTLKSSDLALFHTTSSSPLSLLWFLNFKGYLPFQTAPLFWVQSAEFKKLAQLPLTRNRFSYEELQQAIYGQSSRNEALVRRLITYHFLQAYLNSSQTSQRFELSSFLPGLWIQWQGADIVIAAIPAQSPWPFLKRGQIVTSGVQDQAGKIIKQDKQLAEEWSNLSLSLKEFENLQNGPSSIERAFRERFVHLQAKHVPPKDIQRLLEQEYPVIQRLQSAGSLFKSLPSRYKEGEWFPLKALTTQTYHPSSNQLQPIGNFTTFTDTHFQSVREAYLKLEESLSGSSTSLQEGQLGLALALQKAYQSLSGQIFQEAHGKSLSYPSTWQLKLEFIYMHYPWISFLIFLYGIATCLWMIACRVSTPSIRLTAITLTSLALICHTGLLVMRCYILGRPPVSNMFETVIYVPWIATCASLLIPLFRRQSLVLLASCLTSIILLLILEITNLNQNLDQVQAVLDSQFWLMVHVLLVVGSYGIFILGAIIGHFYLGNFIIQRQETSGMKVLSQIILQTMYGGTALLIIGTILGGVWAAQSWGRFWDWDPKESWAFISSCFYLIWIHAYRFHRIASFGLAIGAVSGLMTISFTWYGVNYILGTGLHSYGFGSGGELYYYLFLCVEILFLTIALGRYSSSQLYKSLHMQ